MATTSGMTRKTLKTMNKQELQVIMDRLKIAYDEKDTNPTLVALIEESGKYSTANETGAGKVTVNGKGEKVHPTLGKYLKVRVHPTASANAKSSVFVSINLYTVEFQPSEIVSLPISVVKFLKNAGEVEHYYDPSLVTENGNIGGHTSRLASKYIVELVNEELEDTII